MTVIVTESYEQSCQVVADRIIDLVKGKPDAKLALATGGTAENVYPLLVKAYEEKRVSFAGVSTVNLDEYIGMDPSAPQSYRKCMDSWFFDKVDIDKARTYVASGVSPVEQEIALFNEKLYADGRPDLQLLGVGVSGHIGFNEPGDTVTAGVHIEELDEATIASNARYFDSPDDVPRKSITMGIGDILKAKQVVLIATGEHKAAAMKRLVQDDVVDPRCPVTFVKLHPDATIVIDKALADMIGYKA